MNFDKEIYIQEARNLHITGFQVFVYKIKKIALKIPLPASPSLSNVLIPWNIFESRPSGDNKEQYQI